MEQNMFYKMKQNDKVVRCKRDSNYWKENTIFITKRG